MPKKDIKMTEEAMEEATEVKEESLNEGAEGAFVTVAPDKDFYEFSRVKEKYRYYCDACTNVAFYSETIKEGLDGICQACGKQYVTRKENYIKL